MRKIKIHPSILCYYVRECVNLRDKKTGAWHLSNNPVACIMFARDRNDRWHRGIAIEPVDKRGESFSYDAYRALAYKRLASAVRSQRPGPWLNPRLPTTKRFFDCDNTDNRLMVSVSEAGCSLTNYERHIVKASNPDVVTLSVSVNKIPGVPEKGGQG